MPEAAVHDAWSSGKMMSCPRFEAESLRVTMIPLA